MNFNTSSITLRQLLFPNRRPIRARKTAERSMPSPRFRNWVRAFGVNQLARELGQGRTVVHSWLHPTSPYPPKLGTAFDIQEISRTHPRSPSPLGIEDIYVDRAAAR